MKNLLTAIEQANKLAQAFGLQFFAYVSDGEQKENLSSNLVLSDLETVVGGLREWRTGPIPEPTGPSILLLEGKIVMPAVYVCMYALDYWPKSGNEFGPVKMIEFFEDDYTGRWIIQQITLPCSDPTNPKR